MAASSSNALPARMCPLLQSRRPGFMKRTRPAKPIAAPMSWARSSGSGHKKQPDRDRPERHRVGEHNRLSGWQDRQADDAELSDPEQSRPLTARWQQRLPCHEQGWRDQGKAAYQPEQHEDQRRHLAESELHQKPIPGPRQDHHAKIDKAYRTQCGFRRRLRSAAFPPGPQGLSSPAPFLVLAAIISIVPVPVHFLSGSDLFETFYG